MIAKGKPTSSFISFILIAFIAIVSGVFVFHWVFDTQVTLQNLVRSDVQFIGLQQIFKIDSQFRNEDVNLLSKLSIRVKNDGFETIPSGVYKFYFNGLYCASTKPELQLESGKTLVIEFNDSEVIQSYIANECINEAASASFRNQSMPFSIEDPTGKMTTSYTVN